MNKHAKQTWPTWKIVAVAVACGLAGTAFWVAYTYMPGMPATATQPAPVRAPGSQPDPTQGFSSVGLANIVVLLGLLCWGAALTCIGCLGYRMYMRIPAWKRRQLFGRDR
jgi:hypothetical protein